MYSENLARDLKLVARAVATNLVARWAPAAYVRITHQTGRGAEEAAAEIAEYFIRSVEDYRAQWASAGVGPEAALDGCRVLEYGPGDILGVALLLYGLGAQQVDCVDRFPLEGASEKNLEVYRQLICSLPEPARSRAAAAFKATGDPASGFRPECVRYRVTPNGLSGEDGAYDRIVSRAVLEHVNSLPLTLRDMERGLRPGGLAVHSVDLRSHNLDRYVPLDFLTWPDWLYQLMYSHKGFPNRLRVGDFRDAIGMTSLELLSITPTSRAAAADLDRVRPHLPARLRDADPDELAWLGFWITLRRPDHPDARGSV